MSSSSTEDGYYTDVKAVMGMLPSELTLEFKHSIAAYGATLDSGSTYNTAKIHIDLNSLTATTENPGVSVNCTGGYDTHGWGSSSFSITSCNANDSGFVISFNLSVSSNNGALGTGSNNTDGEIIVTKSDSIDVQISNGSCGCSNHGGYNEGGSASTTLTYVTYGYQ